MMRIAWRLLLAAGVALAPEVGLAADCDANGIPDEEELRPILKLEASEIVAEVEAPGVIIAADLDGDGHRELAIAGRAAGAVTVLSDLEPGRRPRRADVAVAEAPSSLAAADLDGDGDLDLAAAGGAYPAPGWVRPLWNGAAGDFVAGEAVASPQAPFSLVAADLDGDGLPDLAVGDALGTAGIVRNAGQGVFEPGPSLAAGRGVVATAAGDLDGDGDVDLAASAQLSGTVTIFWSEAGVFGTGPVLQGARLPHTLLAEDLDGNGAADLAAAFITSRDVWTFSHSEGSFRSRIAATLDEDALALASGDLDGDRAPDLIVLTASPGIRTTDIQNEPHGAAVVLRHRGEGIFEAGGRFPIGAPATSLTLSDLDGDGRHDIAAAHQVRGSITITWMGEEGSPASGSRQPASGDGKLSVRDFDGDGRLDLAMMGNGPSSTMVFWNEGGGSLRRRSLPFKNVSSVRAGDLDGDGVGDLIISDRPGPGEDSPPVLIPYFGEVGRTFATGEAIELSARTRAMALGDLDGDGDHDVARSISRRLELAWSRGGRRLEIEPGPELEGTAEIDDIAIADLEGDGRGDLILIGRGFLSAVLSEVGGFRESARLAGSPFPSRMAVGDLDSDGDLDVVAADLELGELFLFASDGQGAFTGLPPLQIGFAHEELREFFEHVAVATGDLNGDGRTDLAVAIPAAARVQVLLNRGLAGFEAPRAFLVSGRPADVAIADLDGRGMADLIVFCAESYDLWVLRNHTAPPRASDCDGNGLLDTCDIAAGAEDADADGIPDRCGRRFLRGDANQDAARDLSDAVAVLGFLFLGEPAALGCLAAADLDRSGTLELTDAVSILDWLFLDGPPPPAPSPGCGFVPGPPGCAEFAGC